ncbi:hypothetical protein H1R20_g3912, partial [Candolleomyces eurysporus]
MSFLARLLQRTLASKDEEADIVLAASSTPGKKKDPTDTDRKKINDFLKLADVNDIDIKARLAAYRDCNAAIAELPPNAGERAEVLNKCINIVCPPRNKFPPIARARAVVPSLSSDFNAFHRVVEGPATVLPDLEQVFEELFEGKDTVKHPSGLSALTFAFANLIAMCRTYPKYDDITVNQTSGLLDLYPLYGSNDEDARDTIRVVEPDETGWGLLQPDAFFEAGERLEFLSPATSVLLILFNRNHNSIARKLLKENQQKRWVDPTTLDEESDERQLQDDEIFALAKKVNCAVFRKIVTTDFLKGLLGLSPLDDAPSIDLFTITEDSSSHWLATLSEHEVDVVKEALSQIDEDPEDVTTEELSDWYSEYANVADMERGTRPCVGLVRGDGNKFNDNELATVVQKATEASAHAFRARGTAELVGLFEISAMERARKYEVCTFNKFREALGLPAYKSFEEWSGNAEVSRIAQGLYQKIENLELYPGLRGEKAIDGKGFRLGETMTYALITDIVQVVRSDYSFKQDQKLEEETKLGAEMIKPNTSNGSFGSILPAVILDNLPNNYDYNSAYGLFPFVTPEKAKELLKERADQAAAEDKPPVVPSPEDVDFGKPKPPTNTHTITDPKGAQQILDDSKKFKNPLADDLAKLTDGLGTLLGHDKDSHAEDDHNIISSLLADRTCMRRYSIFIETAIKRYLKRYSKRAGKRHEVNYQDVANGAAAAWAAEILCGITLDQKDRLTTEDFFQKLKDINDTLFGTVAPQDKFTTLKKAKDAAQLIRNLIENSLEHATADPCEESFFEWLLHLLQELLLDEEFHYHPTKPAHDFLVRVSASGKDRKELSATVLGFAVFTSITFAKTLGIAVSCYMADAREKEREALKTASTKEQGAAKPLSTKERQALDRLLLGYVREAERLSQTGPTTRVATEDTTITLSTGETVQIKKGDRIIIDLSEAQENIDQNINPNNPTKISFLPLIEGTVPAAIKVIFGLKDVKPEKGNCMLSYLREEQNNRRNSKMKIGRKGVPIIQRIFDVLYVIAFIYFLSWAWSALGNAFDHLNTVKCSNPTHIRPWEAYTMLPGPDNRTAPFIVTLDNPKKRRISFVDIDQRDMRFKVSVNGKKKALSSDFVLDRRVECGDDAEQCLKKGFSQASVIVSGGKQVLKVEWVGKVHADTLPGTNLIDWGVDKRRRFMWKQEAC